MVRIFEFCLAVFDDGFVEAFGIGGGGLCDLRFEFSALDADACAVESRAASGLACGAS